MIYIDTKNTRFYCQVKNALGYLNAYSETARFYIKQIAINKTALTIKRSNINFFRYDINTAFWNPYLQFKFKDKIYPSCMPLIHELGHFMFGENEYNVVQFIEKPILEELGKWYIRDSYFMKYFKKFTKEIDYLSYGVIDEYNDRRNKRNSKTESGICMA